MNMLTCAAEVAVPDTGPIDEFAQQLLAAIRSGQNKLPPWPQDLERLRLALLGDVVKVRQLSRIVANSPLLVMKLVQAARSPLFEPAGVLRIEISEAIARLGPTRLRCLAYALAMTHWCEAPRLQHLRPGLRNLADTGTTAAAAAWLIAGRLNAGLQDEAMFAGLLHGVGKLCLLSNLEVGSDLHANRALQLQLLARWQARVAAALAPQLRLPEWLQLAFGAQESAADDCAPQSGLSEILAAAICIASSPTSAAETAERLVGSSRLACSAADWQDLLGKLPATANAMRALFGA
jgi:HD-like signal output (HDOD) protein